MADKIGIINEQGDLGLNYDELSEKEQHIIQREYDKHLEEKRKLQGKDR